MKRRTPRREDPDDDIVVLDSIGTPALCFAVPATLRLLQGQFEELRRNRARLEVHQGTEDATRPDHPGSGARH